MKRRILSIFCSLVIVFVSTFFVSPVRASSAVYAGRVKTYSSPLNIRCENTTDSEIITEIGKNSFIRLISKENDWWKVEYEKDKFGWCHADYIEKNEATEMYVSDSCEALNVRKNRGTKYEITDVLQSGKCVYVLKEYGNWSKILYDGTETGYVCNSYLTDECNKPYRHISLDTVLYKQTDSRWADEYLGQSEKTIASSGCTTSCLAMSESYMKNESIYPDEMEDSLSYSYSGSLYWPCNYETQTDDNAWAQQAYELLQEGKPVIIGAEQESGRQHWVLIKGYDGDGNTLEPDRFIINDPATASRQHTCELFDDYPYFLKIAYPAD